MKLRRKKLNKLEVEVLETPSIKIGVKIRKRFSGFSVFTKMLALVLLFALNFSGILAIRDTVSYYNDTENSPSNTYAAGTLDFELSSVSDFLPNEVCINQTSSRTINFLNLANLPKYKVNATSFVGVACDYLNLTAKLDGTTTYSGSLKNFITNEILFNQPDVWTFDLTLQASTPVSAQGQSCNFKFVFFGSQERNNLVFGQGFNDKEEINNTAAICNWQKILINKVFATPDREGFCPNYTYPHGRDIQNEWVELYNPSLDPVDISGWQICDGKLCDTIPGPAIIPGYGFAVITNTTSTWNYWNAFPANAIKIALLDPIGDGLYDNYDMLLLKNTDGMILDQMNWGYPPHPTSTWPNFNSDVWSPGVIAVPDGHMMARVPTGTDTDTRADWHNLSLPKVTVTAPPAQNWYCGGTYNVKWTTINPNGSTSTLSVDVVYIKDSNKNGVIDSTDQTYLEAHNIFNTGSYSFKVDSSKGYCYLGNVWVKIIATGPENFMLNNYAQGGPYYEPVDEEIFDPTAMCADVAGYCAGVPETCADIEQFCSDWELFELEQAAAALAIGGLEQEDMGGIDNIDIPTVEVEEIVVTTTEEIATTSQEIIGPVIIDIVATTTEEIATTTEEIATTTEEIATTTEEIATTSQEIIIIEETATATSTEETATTTEEAVITSQEIIEDIQVPEPIIEPLENVVIEETPAAEEPIVAEPEIALIGNLEPTPNE